MKTLVFQSYRTTAVPSWIGYCMNGVQQWAATQGFTYLRTGDELFEEIPEWVRPALAHHMCLRSDMARMVYAKHALDNYDRVIWVDADALILDRGFAPSETQSTYCYEVWFNRRFHGLPRFALHVNNAVSVYQARDRRILEEHIQGALHIANWQHSRSTPLDGCAIGTHWLTARHLRSHLNLATTVGNFGSFFVRESVQRPTAIFTQLMHWRFRSLQPGPIQVANIAHSQLKDDPKTAEDFIVLLENGLFAKKFCLQSPEFSAFVSPELTAPRPPEAATAVLAS